ncbi:hypothetical protein FN846DRAFT_1022785, partial [Sphaerosporella brunnea]
MSSTMSPTMSPLLKITASLVSIYLQPSSPIRRVLDCHYRSKCPTRLLDHHLAPPSKAHRCRRVLTPFHLLKCKPAFRPLQECKHGRHQLLYLLLLGCRCHYLRFLLLGCRCDYLRFLLLGGRCHYLRFLRLGCRCHYLRFLLLSYRSHYLRFLFPGCHWHYLRLLFVLLLLGYSCHYLRFLLLGSHCQQLLDL